MQLLGEMRALGAARGLLGMMVRRELAARHAGSVVGVGWVYIQPLLMMAAYYFMFDVVFKARLGEGAPTRAVGAFLIVGMLPWQAFCEAMSRSASSLIESGDLLQKNPLPFALFPVRAVASTVIVYCPLFLLLTIAYAPVHRFGLGLLALPVWLCAQFALSVLLGYFLALLAAAMRDVLQILGFVLNIGIFASPVLFPVSMFPEALRPLLWLNPMTPLVQGYQMILLQGQAPALADWLGVLCWISALVLLLDRMLKRTKEHVVDWL